MSLLLFGLGLRAPGVVTAQDYMNLNNSFQSPPDPSQVSILILLTPNQQLVCTMYCNMYLFSYS